MALASVPMEDSTYLEEVEALKAIYIREMDVSYCPSTKQPLCISINLHPATADNADEQFVCLTLIIKLPLTYPNDLPEISIRNPRGLSDEDLDRITNDLLAKAKENQGNAMLFELIEMVKERLTLDNTPRCLCAICLYEFSPEDVFNKTECYHYFHSHCLARYVESVTDSDAQSPVKVLCPVCREPINSNLDLLKAPPPSRSETAAEFRLDEELKRRQETMAATFAKQKSQGGIIDIEAEKNKFLIEISTVANNAELQGEPVKTTQTVPPKPNRQSRNGGRNHQNQQPSRGDNRLANGRGDQQGGQERWKPDGERSSGDRSQNRFGNGNNARGHSREHCGEDRWQRGRRGGPGEHQYRGGRGGRGGRGARRGSHSENGKPRSPSNDKQSEASEAVENVHPAADASIGDQVNGEQKAVRANKEPYGRGKPARWSQGRGERDESSVDAGDRTGDVVAGSFKGRGGNRNWNNYDDRRYRGRGGFSRQSSSNAEINVATNDGASADDAQNQNRNCDVEGGEDCDHKSGDRTESDRGDRRKTDRGGGYQYGRGSNRPTFQHGRGQPHGSSSTGNALTEQQDWSVQVEVEDQEQWGSNQSNNRGGRATASSPGTGPRINNRRYWSNNQKYDRKGAPNRDGGDGVPPVGTGGDGRPQQYRGGRGRARNPRSGGGWDARREAPKAYHQPQSHTESFVDAAHRPLSDSQSGNAPVVDPTVQESRRMVLTGPPTKASFGKSQLSSGISAVTKMSAAPQQGRAFRDSPASASVRPTTKDHRLPDVSRPPPGFQVPIIATAATPAKFGKDLQAIVAAVPTTGPPPGFECDTRYAMHPPPAHSFQVNQI